MFEYCNNLFEKISVVIGYISFPVMVCAMSWLFFTVFNHFLGFTMGTIGGLIGQILAVGCLIRFYEIESRRIIDKHEAELLYNIRNDYDIRPEHEALLITECEKRQNRLNAK